MAIFSPRASNLLAVKELFLFLLPFPFSLSLPFLSLVQFLVSPGFQPSVPEGFPSSQPISVGIRSLVRRDLSSWTTPEVTAHPQSPLGCGLMGLTTTESEDLTQTQGVLVGNRL